LQKGSNFAKLALQFSDDKTTAAKGGDMGWIKSDSLGGIFNELFFGKKGEVTIIKNAYGFFVAELSDRGKETKKVQVGVLIRNVEPSSITIQSIYQTASQFLGNYNTGDRFDFGVKKQNFKPVMATLTTSMKTIQGLDNSRDLIQWAFNAELNSLSDIKQYGNKFVIAHLIGIREKGILPLKVVREQVVYSVKKEKKLEQLVENVKKEMVGVRQLEDLANKLQTKVGSAKDISFSSYIIPESGFEPEVIATAVSLLPNKLSAPIPGKNGVYVISVTSIGEKDQNELEAYKIRYPSMYAGKVNGASQVLLKLADIKDRRIKFF
jgi:peptidyl-prolyl cis-trans isomerase D